MNTVNELWKWVVNPSWQAYHGGSSNKKVWSMGFIHGASGVGKTCFNLEFLSLLANFLASNPTAPTWSNRVEPLQAAHLPINGF
jgi:hypothetical protein